MIAHFFFFHRRFDCIKLNKKSSAQYLTKISSTHHTQKFGEVITFSRQLSLETIHDEEIQDKRLYSLELIVSHTKMR